MNLGQLLRVGGVTMYVLLFFSVLSLTIILERLIYYHRRSRVRRGAFMKKIAHLVSEEEIGEALEICAYNDTPFSSVVA